ncbi:MAG: hypothetical protein PHI27_02035 [Eubacteriales bacterium]|nr:hypothetical protein [Eubacteriales bacterium]MDD3881012.1 hypothetical protein [Eubacteriales bacterium]MDD4511919.1 hypothetical protein [Eubacteriales bacterium]
MKYCPKCGCEYMDEATECVDCHLPLSDTPPEGEVWTARVKEPECCYIAQDDMQADLLCDFLRDSGIDCYHRGNEFGGYNKVIFGYSVYGEMIMVEKDKKDEARALVEEFLSAPICEDEYQDAALLDGTAEELEELSPDDEDSDEDDE